MSHHVPLMCVCELLMFVHRLPHYLADDPATRSTNGAAAYITKVPRSMVQVHIVLFSWLNGATWAVTSLLDLHQITPLQKLPPVNYTSFASAVAGSFIGVVSCSWHVVSPLFYYLDSVCPFYARERFTKKISSGESFSERMSSTPLFSKPSHPIRMPKSIEHTEKLYWMRLRVKN